MRRIICILCLAIMGVAHAQQELPKAKLYDAKKHLREGNNAYEKKKYADAAIAYQKSVAQHPTYYKGAYNLGNAYFNQKKYKEAITQYQLALKLANNKKNIAKVNESIGDAFKKEKDLEKALEAYKQALLKNPSDDVLRQKYIAAKQEKQQQDQQNQQNKDNKDKQQQNKDKQDKGDNKENNNDGEDDTKDANKNSKGEDKPDKENNQDINKDANKTQDQGKNKEQPSEAPQPNASKLTPEQIEQLLESMSNEEQKTQKKVNAQKVKAKTNKNEKDW